MNMKKDKFTAKATDKCLSELENVIVACEFDEQGNISDRILNRLYAAQDLIELVQSELKQIGAI
jgi:hypothetical protein